MVNKVIYLNFQKVTIKFTLILNKNISKFTLIFRHNLFYLAKNIYLVQKNYINLTFYFGFSCIFTYNSSLKGYRFTQKLAMTIEPSDYD